MKIPKKLVTSLVGASASAVTYASNIANDKLKEKQEKKEQERKYNDQKHNGIIKYASIALSLVGLFLSVVAFKHSDIISGIIGLLSVVAYVITFLYCLEIITEKKQNIYQVVFIIGDMILVIAIALLFF